MYPALRVKDVTVATVIVGFSRTGDGYNHWQGATYARANKHAANQTQDNRGNMGVLWEYDAFTWWCYDGTIVLYIEE